MSAPMPAEGLAPGFMVVHGNQAEQLRDLLVAWLTRHPLAPLETEHVLVQSNGVAQWLKMSLARAAPAGGCGIAAALRTELPSRFLWEAYRAVLGADAVPAASPFDKAPLAWRLMRLVPALVAQPAFEPLRQFLAQDPDSRKRHQLAARLADLLDQYQVYRADWLADWAAGRDQLVTAQGLLPVPPGQAWQPLLWRALLADVGEMGDMGDMDNAGAASGRAAVHQRFIERAAHWQGERPAGLPRRLVVFGISSLPQQSLEVLAALARWVQVLLFVHNPSAHDWSHIVAERDLLRAQRRRQRRRPGSEGEIAAEALHLHAHPLLAAWGKQGRDFIRLLDQHDEHQAYAQRFAAIGQRVDCFDGPAPDTLLRQLQEDIRELRPLHESRAHWAAQGALTAQATQSVAFHIAHSPQREVEVLHDALLAAFAADPDLSPRDVVVMVPDLATYAAHVKAVFGLLPPGDRRHIPFALADPSLRRQDALVGALDRLLALPQSRLAASDLLDLLEVGALRARFGIAQADLPLLARWIAAANVRWGLHAQHRATLGLPPDQAFNSWDFGLQRMLLGYASGDSDDWAGVAPLDEVGGLDAALLGPLVALLQALDAWWRQLADLADSAVPATPAVWGQRIRALLDDFFAPAQDQEQLVLLRLRDALQAWLQQCADGALHEPVALPVVREHLMSQLDAGGLGQPFLSGGVTFATLMPMRAIPFRVVALLGMNDGDYPRQRVPMDFDLMAQDWRPGDRSRREDDRYLFFEAVLSARDRLHISWVGRSILDDTPRPPSVLVAQLRDHLAAGWRLAGDEALPAAQAGRRLLDALTVTHRLQPFHADYFSAGGDVRLFSHAREWRGVLQTGAQVGAQAGAQVGAQAGAHAGIAPPAPPVSSAPLPRWRPAGPIALHDVQELLRAPAQAFMRQRLHITLRNDEESNLDHEPFALDGLGQWQHQDMLIQLQLAALRSGRDPAAALEAGLRSLSLRGDLPAGAFDALQQRDLAEPMAGMLARYRRTLADWPEPRPDLSIDLPFDLTFDTPADSTTHRPAEASSPLRLQDTLDALRSDAQGRLARVCVETSALIDNNKYRRDKAAPYWVQHLAAHQAGVPLTTVIVGKQATITLHPLAPEQATAFWQALVNAWHEGMTRPLPLALRTALQWRTALVVKSDAPEREDMARAEARKVYEGGSGQDGKAVPGERDRHPALARAFPDFDALWAGGEFAEWAQALVAPLAEAVPLKHLAGADAPGPNDAEAA